jgi:elongation factor 2
VIGIDDVFVKSGTITNLDSAYPLKAMRFSVSPVVRVAVEPKSAADLLTLVDGLKSLSKSDPLIKWYYDESTRQYIIEGAGELHLEIALKDLQEFAGVELKTSDPVVSFRESVSSASSLIALAKSANKHNRLYMSAGPIGELSEAMEAKKIELHNTKVQARQLVEDFSWDPNDAKKVWTFGPDSDGPNVFVDVTKGVMGLNDIRDNVEGGFDMAVRQGVLCGEPVRGVRINLHDAMIHSDPPHRNAVQISPAAKRAAQAAMLAAHPVLLEPVYLVDITCPQDVAGAVYGVVNRRRGNVISEEPRLGTPMVLIKAHLPVLESFGFAAFLRSQTSGQAFPQSVFDHWQALPGDPLTPGTKAHEVVMEVRKRKGMKEALPTLEQLNDKL